MEPASRHQVELEAKIPDSLQGVSRVCNREECGSSNIELKYFDNKEKVGYNQPRFFCKSCQRTFTLGGKVRGEYKKANRKTKKVKIDTTAANIQAQGVETSKHNQSKQLDLEKNHSSRSLNTEALSLSLGMKSKGVCSTGEAASSENIQTNLEEKTQETDSVEENAVPFQIDDCEDANWNSEEANCNLEGDKMQEDQTEDDFHNIGEALLQKDLLKHNAQLHLLNAQVTIHDVQVKKEATNIDLSCKAFAGESQADWGFKSKKKQDKIDEGIVGLQKFAEEAAGGLVSPSKYHEMVANEAQTEVMSQVITSMHSKVQEMDVKHVPYSIMVATEEKAKQFQDRVMELVD